MSEIKRSAAGVKETSYYGTLENLFNEVGKTIKPKVRCVINLANKGAGIPDGGLFTPDQFQKRSDELIEGQLPARGAIEVKGTGEHVDLIKDSAPVAKYLNKYGQVLVTNYRDFLLVALDENNQPKALERYGIAADETSFWQKADHANATTEPENERLVDFLKRVMLHAAPLVRPEDVAWFLASYARDARARVEQADVSALDTIRKALEESLGIKFEGEKGEHFFRSTLVQTLFYGIFSAWVLWHKRYVSTGSGSDRGIKFEWRKAVWELKVPMISILFGQLATPANVKQLDLEEVLDWTENVLNRVVREEFFARFAEDHAVQYFYEPFLQAFDPDLRKQLGVWYTPEEIVRYMVERVDRVLREELHLTDGLADESVYVLDPACGTGAYLVEVLRRINRTLEEKGEEMTRGMKLKKAASQRVFGFEILPAPFVVSHLQIGLLLEELQTGFSEDKNERAGVYLTNSLTGWDEHPKTKLPFPEFEEERDSADKVKKESPILVILGNPPYNAFAGVSPEEEMGLVEPYKKGLVKEWGIKKFNLDDLYVRFFRLAERKIAEQTRKGVVCFISNYSYLREPSFVVMRKKFLSEFDQIWIDCLNGDSRATGKLTPGGKPDPSAFSTEQNREGIRKGTALGVFVKQSESAKDSAVKFKNFWGVYKRSELLRSLDDDNFEGSYETTEPERFNRFCLAPFVVSDEYKGWPKLDELCEIAPFNGPVERRGFALISIDQIPLAERIKKYFDPQTSNDQIEGIHASLMMTGNRIVGPDAREKILREFEYDETRIVRYPFKPFDIRYCYLENLRPLFSEPSPQLLSQRFDENAFFITRDSADKIPEGSPFYFSKLVCDYDSISGHARHFPLRYRLHLSKANKTKNDGQHEMFGAERTTDRANLSPNARKYFDALGYSDVDKAPDIASLIWFHALAIGYSPEYLSENADGIRQDFPRIPLPAKRDDLIASAALGKRVAALLDTEKAVAGVTAGAIMPELRTLCVAAHVEGKQFTENDFRVTAGWGHGGKDGVTMPGKGRGERREYTEKELAVLDEAALAAFGPQTFDIYLNNLAYWRNVPERVWNYYIGGYQVVKKWLSYREFDLLGRPLRLEEIEEVTNMIRRIAALLLLEPELNTNYQKIKKGTLSFGP